MGPLQRPLWQVDAKLKKKQLMASFCIQGGIDASSMPCAAVIWFKLSAVPSIKTRVIPIIPSLVDLMVQ